MTRPAAPLLLLLALAACGGAPRAPAEPENPTIAACRAESRAATDTRAVWREQNVDNRTHTDALEARIREAELRAFNDCLRARGLSRGGGVEAVRRPNSLLSF
jgi:membrane-bound lytic murein transglycosylase B